MSFLSLRLAPVRAASTATRLSRSAASVASSFHTSSARASLNESDREAHPSVETHIETHKQELLKAQKEGKGEWKAELASNSEQVVKHDKHDLTIEEMQKLGAAMSEAGKQPNKVGKTGTQ